MTVKQLRAKRNLTQAEFARRCEVLPQAINRIDNTDISELTPNYLMKISKGIDDIIRVTIADGERRVEIISSNEPGNYTPDDFLPDMILLEDDAEADTYFRSILGDNETKFQQAKLRLRAEYTVDQILAMSEALNGIMFVDDMPLYEQVRASIEDAFRLYELPKKFKLTESEEDDCCNLEDHLAEPLRIVAAEVMRGRKI